MTALILISSVLLACASQNALTASVYLLKQEPPRLLVEKLFVPLTSIKRLEDILPYPEYMSDRRYEDAYFTTKRFLDQMHSYAVRPVATYEEVAVQPVLQEEVQEEMLTRNLPIEEANEADNYVGEEEVVEGKELAGEEDVSRKKHKKKLDDDDGRKNVKLFKKPRKEVEKITIARDAPVKKEYEFALGANDLKMKIPLAASQ